MPLLALLGGGIPWKLIGIGAAAVALLLFGIFIVGTIKENGRLKGEVVEAVSAANANAAIAKYQRNQNAIVLTAVDKAAAHRSAQRHKADIQRRGILDAPPSDDGPLAPVLRRTLDGLRRYEGDGETRAIAAGANSGSVAAPLPRTGPTRP